MSQADLSIDNISRSLFRLEVNASLQALATLSSGDTEPTTTYPYQWWADTTTGILKMRNGANDAWIDKMSLATGLIIGTDVQAYDADTAKLDVAQTFTISQRAASTTDNDLSFNLSTTNNFKCTPTAGGALTFTNHVAGQSGYVLLDNSGGYAITAAATTKVGAAFLANISVAGVYLISYYDDGTNAYCTASGALS